MKEAYKKTIIVLLIIVAIGLFSSVTITGNALFDWLFSSEDSRVNEFSNEDLLDETNSDISAQGTGAKDDSDTDGTTGTGAFICGGKTEDCGSNTIIRKKTYKPHANSAINTARKNLARAQAVVEATTVCITGLKKCPNSQELCNTGCSSQSGRGITCTCKGVDSEKQEVLEEDCDDTIPGSVECTIKCGNKVSYSCNFERAEIKTRGLP